ncbi:hypothetical protein [Marinomonas transparens]|uniref:Uncharacterized protein n=1 Tax=Marinomonas transparens TaxID=2795388 RepID=A0A934JNA6_9GAMM|nr:hypothetical protein [Marinomonas transparens]MBJ7539385.1 hypothetical protein [Marinomonas transparens]
MPATTVSAQAVGFGQSLLYADSDRPLKTSVWYPSVTTFPRERIADNAAFLDTDVVRIGTPLAGTFPLVVISHGYHGKSGIKLCTKMFYLFYVSVKMISLL